MTQTDAADTSSDAVVDPQTAEHVDFPAEPAFAVSSTATVAWAPWQSTATVAWAPWQSTAAVAWAPWKIPVIVSPIVGGGEREPTDEELLQGLRDLMAEDERELGPIPEEARAEVERQWRD